MHVNIQWHSGERKYRGNRHKLKNRKFHLNTRFLSPVNILKGQNRLSREVVESLSLEIFKPNWTWP